MYFNFFKAKKYCSDLSFLTLMGSLAMVYEIHQWHCQILKIFLTVVVINSISVNNVWRKCLLV